MKKTFATFLAAGFSLAAFGSPVTPEQALQRLQSDSSARRVRAAQQASSFKWVASMPELYVFSSGKGYVVCPADDSAPALLGYSDSGQFDPEENPALKSWLDSYAEQIAAGATAKVSRPARQAVAPMIKSKWAQTEPFNEKCPTIDGVPCPVGCVAMSMAQVMHYHQWPKKGTGSNSYTWQGKTLSFDFGATEFDWANMVNVYDGNATKQQIDAVATLCSACGIGVNMNYTARSSGATAQRMGQFLTENMGYGKDIQWADRRYYSLLEWENLIYADLAKGLPVLFSGNTAAGGGHQFVCDGYDGDGYFHINWGWGGVSDGYFLLSILHPTVQGTGGSTGGYNLEQFAMLNVHPAKGNEKPVYSISFENGFIPVEAESYGVGKALKFGGRVLNTSALPIPKETTVTIYFQNLDNPDGSRDFSYDEWLSNPVDVNRGWWNLGFDTFGSYNEPGTYKVYAYFTLADSYTVNHPVQVAHGTPDHQIMTLSKDGVITFEAADIKPGDPKASNIKLVTPYFLGKNKPLVTTFTLTNESNDIDFRGKVYPALLDTEYNKVVAQGAAVYANLMPGQAEEYSFSGTLSDADYLTPGNYKLAVVDEKSTVLGSTTDIYVDNEPDVTEYVVSGFSLVEQTPGSNVITDARNVQFKLSVQCTKGYFYGQLRVRIFPDNSLSYPLTSPFTPYFNCGAGEEDELIVTLNLSDIENGKYWAIVTDAGQSILDKEHVHFVLDAAPEVKPEPEPEPEPIVATEVLLSQTSMTLEEGQTSLIVAIVKPADAENKAIDWSSSNPAVASVTNGEVSALTPGTATITATCGKVSATCTVTVTAKPIIGEDGLSELSTINHQLSTTFDLQGRRVTNPRHGLYIINGRKILK